MLVKVSCFALALVAVASRTEGRNASVQNFDTESLNAVAAFAKENGWPARNLAAVVQVESRGEVFTQINGQKLPLIMYEAHVFERSLEKTGKSHLIAQARRERLAATNWGGVPYLPTQYARYDQLRRAALIDEESAYRACSWGVGQILGENAASLGFPSSKALALQAMSGLNGQLDLTVKFIKYHKIGDEMTASNWFKFATVYNGDGQASDYSKRMASAYTSLSGVSFNADGVSTSFSMAGVVPPDLNTPRPLLDLGTRLLKRPSGGHDVVALQRVLKALDYDVTVDGDFGPGTQKAMKAFQVDNGLTDSGELDDATRAKLIAAYKLKTGDSSTVADVGASTTTGTGATTDASMGVAASTTTGSGVTGQGSDTSSSTSGVGPAGMSGTDASATSSVGGTGDELLVAKLGTDPIGRGEKDATKVRALQETLNELGFSVGAVDGDFGGGTERALKSFQAKKGISETGVVDSKTLAELKEAWLIQLTTKAGAGETAAATGGDTATTTDNTASSTAVTGGPGVTGTTSSDTSRTTGTSGATSAGPVGVTSGSTGATGSTTGTSGTTALTLTGLAADIDGVMLRRGDKGPKVRALQEMLGDVGHSVGAPDGDFGPGTERGVRAFQKAEGVSESGEVDAATRSALQRAWMGRQGGGGGSTGSTSTGTAGATGSTGTAAGGAGLGGGKSASSSSTASTGASGPATRGAAGGGGGRTVQRPDTSTTTNPATTKSSGGVVEGKLGGAVSRLRGGTYKSGKWSGVGRYGSIVVDKLGDYTYTVAVDNTVVQQFGKMRGVLKDAFWVEMASGEAKPVVMNIWEHYPGTSTTVQ